MLVVRLAIVKTSDLDSGLRTELAAVEAIQAIPTPVMFFEDVVLRRKPSHKERAEQAFAHHTPLLAALLAAACREGDLSGGLVAEIENVLELSRLRNWAMACPELELIHLVRLPETVEMLVDLPRNAEVGRDLTYAMAGLARSVLR